MSIESSSQGFTGRHMLLVSCAFFGIVIAVNFTMAWLASTSWSGLVVENTYVASQEFNRKAEAMKAMTASGVSGALSINGGLVHYLLRNRDGSPTSVDEVVLKFKRPVGDHEDFNVVLRKTGEGRFEGEHSVAAGDWIVEAISKRSGEIVMHEAKRIDTAEFDQ